MTTPDEFLQFAKDMGLNDRHSSVPATVADKKSDTNPIGLAVLKNLCRLVEQTHQLKCENDRLRAQLAFVNHLEIFSNHSPTKISQGHRRHHHPTLFPFHSVPDEEKTNSMTTTSTLSPKHSFKLRSPFSSRLPKNVETIHHLEETASSIIQLEHDPSDLIDQNSASSTVSTWQNWIKVRHALKFSLRRKAMPPYSPPLSSMDRQIPTISVSIESDEEQQIQSSKKKKNANRTTYQADDTDQDEETNQFVRTYHQQRLDGNDTTNSSSVERQEMTSAIDDENVLTRKQSKIARYRRKLRSKLDTVKKQFSDQNSSSSLRLFHHSHGSTLDEIGAGINHAYLSAQLAPALTKSYQQKMRQWEKLQKSNFLVNYRRQSITPKIDLNLNSRKASLITAINVPSDDVTLISPLNSDDPSPMECHPSTLPSTPLHVVESNLSPILSPHQRSLILHQWREIMSEEIFLRQYQDFLQKQQILVEQLEGNLKCLKTKIFSTNPNDHRTRSLLDLDRVPSHSNSHLPIRSRSLQSLFSIPASWILAVQSAAYSDILDGTSAKATERTIRFHKDFFDQLEQFQSDRKKFQQDSSEYFQIFQGTKSKPEEKQRRKIRFHRLCVQKMPGEQIQTFQCDPLHVTQSSPITSIDQDLTRDDSTSKSSRHARFDLKKSFQRSKSVCMTQFQTWLHRHRRQPSTDGGRRRRHRHESPSTPKLFGSPRLGRLHQRLFKTSIPTESNSSSSAVNHHSPIVRISSPLPRHRPFLSSLSTHEHSLESPMIDRKYFTSTKKTPTAKERRESFVTLSNIYKQQHL